jgi:arylsulfatase A-like enzyme
MHFFRLPILFIFVLVSSLSAAEKPNFLVIIIDDLNDWVGCLGGHPQVKTPNIDKLAARGINFSNAHIQATYCGPSRISFLSGLHPSTSGCYSFDQYSQVKTLKSQHPFPSHFRDHGFQTYGGGKIFHQGTENNDILKCWDTILPSGRNPRPKKPIHWNKQIWDWGPISAENEEMADFRLSQAAAIELRKKHDRSFFITAGIRMPHVPLHPPEKYFDLYPLKDIQLPCVKEDDLEDVPHPELGILSYAAPVHSDLVEKKLWASLVQAYLASITFVDDCVGEMLKALEEGPNSDNTYVILFSDHGFHLGEKQHWAKRTLWEETTRVPFLISGPGIQPNQECTKPVGMIDIYPTLCDLAKIEHHPNLEGHSLQPLLQNPKADWLTPAITEFNPGQFSVRSEHWRYIRYPDGTEELYDHRTDQKEWHNLAGKEELKDIKTEHSKWIPR